MTASQRHLWLANSSAALNDLEGEISHLQDAAKAEPNSISIHCRLANRLLDIKDRLLDIMDTDGAKEVFDRAKEILSKLERQDPTNSEVKAIAERISKT